MQNVRSSFGVHPRGSAIPVGKFIGSRRKLKVNDKLNFRHVNSTCREIGSQQNVVRPVPELNQGPLAVALFHPAVKATVFQAIFGKEFAHAFNAVTEITENNSGLIAEVLQ